jgi:RNA methyltransferase, TrmH family
MDIKLREYKKDFEYSYCFGVFPTIELLTHQPDKVIKILLSSKGRTNSGLDKIKAICSKHNIPTETADNLVNKLASSENAYAIGVFKKYKTQLNQQENHLVLVNPQDTGNLGTIIRTMVGFNIYDLSLIRPAVDIFNPKTIRASMGAIFQIRFTYFDNFREYQQVHKHNLYPFMTDGKTNLEQVSFQKPYALIFGSESAGLDESFHKIGTCVEIPQNKNIDSLNLSSAVSIALYKSLITS